jgi:hypothetical protein
VPCGLVGVDVAQGAVRAGAAVVQGDLRVDIVERHRAATGRPVDERVGLRGVDAEHGELGVAVGGFGRMVPYGSEDVDGDDQA